MIRLLERQREAFERTAARAAAIRAEQELTAKQYAHNALSEVFTRISGIDPSVIAPDALRSRIDESRNRVVIQATVEVSMPMEEWMAHFDSLLVPFSGPVTYGTEPEDDGPALDPSILCGSPSPKTYGNASCDLPLGHPGHHSHAGREWLGTIRR